MKRKRLDTVERSGLYMIEEKLRRVETLAQALTTMLVELREYVAEEKVKERLKRGKL